MLVRRFLAWSQMVTASQRAEGGRALALGYLYSQMADDTRAEAEAALTGLLDDLAPQVRLALAEAFASAVEAPRHCIIALAWDQPKIAAVVLERSPLLTHEDLIDCAARGEPEVQCAIAARPSLSSAVSIALADSGTEEALIALARNAGAEIPEFSLRRMLERFGANCALREALLTRPQLPASVRSDLIQLAASALTGFVAGSGWLSAERAERLRREVTERAMIGIAVEASQEEPETGSVEMARQLRLAGQLTPSLMLRALLCGDRSLFEAAIAELSEVPMARASGYVRDHRGRGFAALYARARMPADLLPIFKAALNAQDEAGSIHLQEGARLSRALIASVLAACAVMDDGISTKVTALLRRLDLEAAQQDARDVTERVVRELQEPHAPRLLQLEMRSTALATC